MDLYLFNVTPREREKAWHVVNCTIHFTIFTNRTWLSAMIDRLKRSSMVFSESETKCLHQYLGPTGYSDV